jgi:ubiquinone/menaquinone biosynthesis C-methylase UbiE
MRTIEKFDKLAEGYAERTYADPAGFAEARAAVIVSLGPPLVPGDEVLDLACGDALVAEPLLARGLRYRGADGSAGMIEQARRRLAKTVPLEVALMDDYEPPAAVAATLVLNALQYPADRVAFFRRVAGYTTKKLVLDFSPRVDEVAALERDLRQAGLEVAARRAFLVPRTRRLPGPALGALRLVERVDPLAATVLRRGGKWLYAATPVR